MKLRDAWRLLALTLLALAIHGYHIAEDTETYLPAVEKLLRPSLFPVGQEYFALHAHLTFFPELMAALVRLSHLSLWWVLFAVHLASLFLFLAALLRLARCIFPQPQAHWAAVALVTVLLTMPLAGSGLFLMDEFVNPRNLIAFPVTLALAEVLERRYLRAAALLAAAATLHPFMTAFAVSYCLLFAVVDHLRARVFAGGAGAEPALARPAILLLPAGGPLLEHSPAYVLVAKSRNVEYVLHWQWYEILGAIAPVFLLAVFAWLGRRRGMPRVELIAFTTAVFAAIYFVMAFVFGLTPGLENLVRLQPMRSLYLTYLFLLLLGGGLLGRYLLRGVAWRWALLFLPLAAGLFSFQRSLFAHSEHIELPARAPRNGWVQAFVWVRTHTPEDAVFALDPDYMELSSNDYHGFRALALRSQLPDGFKDKGVVEIFPRIADEWLAAVSAQNGISGFTRQQFAALHAKTGAGWAVLEKPLHADLDCPYENPVVAVCRLP